MSWITRVCKIFRREALNSELDEELASHLEEAINNGRTADEARYALGGMLRHREESRDMKLLPWLESLISDIAFGWRQLAKNRAASIAAVLSLALAIGAITGVFRLVEALLLTRLPVSAPEQLHTLAIASRDRDGQTDYTEDFSYSQLREYKKILENYADLLLIGYSTQQDVTFGADDQIEKFYRQYVSGNVFNIFGLQPTLGRLLTPQDDQKPGAGPVAVLSYDYWTRRFGRDPKVIGKTFRYRKSLYEIVGVAPKGFIGTEPGVNVDAFIPATMNTEALNSEGWSWFRIWVRPKNGMALKDIR
jgi:putative ABC transport system permease protein